MEMCVCCIQDDSESHNHLNMGLILNVERILIMRHCGHVSIVFRQIKKLNKRSKHLSLVSKGPLSGLQCLRVSRHALTTAAASALRRRIGWKWSGGREEPVPCEEVCGARPPRPSLTGGQPRSGRRQRCEEMGTGRGCGTPAESGAPCVWKGTNFGFNAFASPRQWWVGSSCGF